MNEFHFKVQRPRAACREGHRVVPGSSQSGKENMTDWRLEVDLKKLNDWLTTCHNMTGGGWHFNFIKSPPPLQIWLTPTWQNMTGGGGLVMAAPGTTIELCY